MGAKWRQRCWSVGALAFSCMILVSQCQPRTARAIPAFARTYKTSCQTCHVAFPKLTPFGEAFRNSGYRFPKDDEDYVKRAPMALGSEAYKRVFPKAVWPGFIPKELPLAIRGTGVIAANLQRLASSQVDFQLPTQVFLMGAGALGEHISWWVGAHLFIDGAIGHLAHSYLIFADLFTWWGLPKHLVNLRVGRFYANAFPYLNRRALIVTGYQFTSFNVPKTLAGFGGTGSAHQHLTTSESGGAGLGVLRQEHILVFGEEPGSKSASIGGGFSLGDFQRGLELYGSVGGRLRYIFGVVNGNGAGAAHDGFFDNNTPKSVYLRLALKLGGMGFDGSGKAQTQPWQDNAVTIGGFSYYGSTVVTLQEQVSEFGYIHADILTDKNGTPRVFTKTSTTTWTNTHWRAGGDLRIHFGDVDLFGAVMFGRDHNAIGDDGYNDSVLYFAEAHVTLYPWLLLAVRFEEGYLVKNRIFLEGPKKDWGLAYRVGVASLTALIRANIKVVLEASLDLKLLNREGNQRFLLALDSAF